MNVPIRPSSPVRGRSRGGSGVWLGFADALLAFVPNDGWKLVGLERLPDGTTGTPAPQRAETGVGR